MTDVLFLSARVSSEKTFSSCSCSSVIEISFVLMSRVELPCPELLWKKLWMQTCESRMIMYDN